MTPKKYRSSKSSNRLGGVAVEFAMVAPIFFLVLFGGIEFASIHVTQCAMENAAFEGARHGIIPGATAQGCREIAENILNVTRIQVFEIEVEPSVIDPSVDEVSVTVRVPMIPENKFGLSAFLSGENLTKTITLPCTSDEENSQ
jgi:Flp pilus assembly protein TadG